MAQAPEDGIWLCSAAGCQKRGSHYFYRDGVLLSAACDEHVSAAAPRVEHQGRQLSVAARMLAEGARSAINYERGLGSSDDEIALAVLEALFGRAAMRGLAHEYLSERDAERERIG